MQYGFLKDDDGAKYFLSSSVYKPSSGVVMKCEAKMITSRVNISSAGTNVFCTQTGVDLASCTPAAVDARVHK